MQAHPNVTIELVFDADCPNVDMARERLRSACMKLDLPGSWREIVRGPGAPRYARGFGSPTVLVNGLDVSPAAEPSASTCRVYPAPDGGFDRAPSVAVIEAALRRALRVT